MERMTGVEPASTAWEAVILPMNYIRMSVAVPHTSSKFSTSRARPTIARCLD